MNKYKITGIDQNGNIIEETKEGASFPQIFNPYMTSNGFYIQVLKIEIVLEASEENSVDSTNENVSDLP